MASTASRVGLDVFTAGTYEAVRPFTKNLFKTPTPPDAAKPATADDPAVQQAVATTSARRSRARGYRSTILSQQFLQPVQPSNDLKATIGA